jgi:hypothetical protein
VAQMRLASASAPIQKVVRLLKVRGILADNLKCTTQY